MVATLGRKFPSKNPLTQKEKNKRTYRRLYNQLHKLKITGGDKDQIKALEGRLEALTEPCEGEAHSNPYIDHCGLCMGVSWGRRLKSE